MLVSSSGMAVPSHRNTIRLAISMCRTNDFHYSGQALSAHRYIHSNLNDNGIIVPLEVHQHLQAIWYLDPVGIPLSNSFDTFAASVNPFAIALPPILIFLLFTLRIRTYVCILSFPISHVNTEDRNRSIASTLKV